MKHEVVEYDVEASHTVNLELENGDTVVDVNPFNMIEGMIEDKIAESDVINELLDKVAELQNLVSKEID